MKFVLLSASDPSLEKIVEANTMEELVENYINTYKCAMIINNDNDNIYNYPTITIYDDYIE